jgi:hypothetical protein
LIADGDALLTYLADLVEEVERFAVTVLPPNDAPAIELGREDDGSLVIDFECRPPIGRRSAPVDMELFERWRPVAADRYERSEYRFELRDHEHSYRRAFHRHDVDTFVTAFDVATHEHCEATLGHVACAHYAGDPVTDAFDGFRRVYELWLSDETPDCAALTCLHR